jgi:hypothetical protein
MNFRSKFWRIIYGVPEKRLEGASRTSKVTTLPFLTLISYVSAIFCVDSRRFARGIDYVSGFLGNIEHHAPFFLRKNAQNQFLKFCQYWFYNRTVICGRAIFYFNFGTKNSDLSMQAETEATSHQSVHWETLYVWRKNIQTFWQSFKPANADILFTVHISPKTRAVPFNI